MATKKGIQQKEKIIETARRIIALQGADALSHKNIGDELGLTKSAVLYHYPTKRALLEGLIKDYVEHLEYQRHCHEAPYIERGLAPADAVLPGMRSWYNSFSKNRHHWIDVGTALLGLGHQDKTLLEPVRDWYRNLYRTIETSNLDVTRAFNVMMAFDGFFTASKLGIMVMDREEVECMQVKLLESAFEGRPASELAIALDEECFLKGDEKA